MSQVPESFLQKVKEFHRFVEAFANSVKNATLKAECDDIYKAMEEEVWRAATVHTCKFDHPSVSGRGCPACDSKPEQAAPPRPQVFVDGIDQTYEPAAPAAIEQARPQPQPCQNPSPFPYHEDMCHLCQFPIAAHAAAEPAPERTPPRWMPISQSPEKYGLRNKSVVFRSKARGYEVADEWRDENHAQFAEEWLDDCTLDHYYCCGANNPCAVAVPEPAAQQAY